jgi:hypothetical protein
MPGSSRSSNTSNQPGSISRNRHKRSAGLRRPARASATSSRGAPRFSANPISAAVTVPASLAVTHHTRLPDLPACSATCSATVLLPVPPRPASKCVRPSGMLTREPSRASRSSRPRIRSGSRPVGARSTVPATAPLSLGTPSGSTDTGTTFGAVSARRLSSERAWMTGTVTATTTPAAPATDPTTVHNKTASTTSRYKQLVRLEN